MNNLKVLAILCISTLVFTGCSDDDDSTPDPVNEEELITTLRVSLDAQDNSGNITMQSVDLDGDGPDAPTITVSGDLVAGTTYDGSVMVLNETESPADNITLEVREEDDEHQFFYTVGGGLDVSTSYDDSDGDGNPVGIDFTLTANSASSGTLTVTLRHEPVKPNTGLADAGGETDVEVSFPVNIQ